MTPHLLAISLGPVQGFIASARRTRDLWCGSYLLSEVSKAAAKAVHDVAHAHGGGLIFPAPSHLGDLAPASPQHVANLILAELRDADPATVAQAAKEAARSHWRQVADAVCHDHRGVIDREIWADQVHDVIEFYAAWAPLADDYPAARRHVLRLLGGRKSCRDFLPAKGRAGVPKSADGLRESVLKDPKKEPWPPHHRRRLRLSGRTCTRHPQANASTTMPTQTPLTMDFCRRRGVDSQRNHVWRLGCNLAQEMVSPSSSGILNRGVAGGATFNSTRERS